MFGNSAWQSLLFFEVPEYFTAPHLVVSLPRVVILSLLASYFMFEIVQLLYDVVESAWHCFFLGVVDFRLYVRVEFGCKAGRMRSSSTLRRVSK